VFSIECVIYRDSCIADLCVIYRACHLYHLSIERVIYRDTCIADLPRARFRLSERGNTRSSSISSESEVSTISGESDHIAHLPRARFHLGEKWGERQRQGGGGRGREGQRGAGGEEGGKERGREWQTVAYLPPLPYSPEGGVLTEKKNKRLWTRGSGHGGCEEGEGRKGEGCFVVPPAGTSLFFLVSFSRTFLIFC
jgi:hypothetical protein